MDAVKFLVSIAGPLMGTVAGWVGVYVTYRNNQEMARNNQLLAEQNQQNRARGESPEMPPALESPSIIRRYWPFGLMALLTVVMWSAVAYDIHERHESSNASAPAGSGELLTRRQIGELANFLNEQCEIVKCQKPEITIFWRPFPDSLGRTLELRSVFDQAFWSINPISGQSASDIRPTVLDVLWWKRAFNGPGIYFFFPDSDPVAQAFYKKLHAVAPTIHERRQEKGWTFWVAGDGEQW